MRWTTRTHEPGGGVLPAAIKWLLIANGAVFALQILSRATVGFDPFVAWLGLQPSQVILRGWVWQPLTYMFVHGGFFHVLLNMFVLWMFGAEIERLWGRSEFLRYYVICGLGAAAASFVFAWNANIVGASGAVLGVLLAFGLLFPERYVYLWFFIPVKAKWLVAGIAAIEILYLVSGGRSGIANAAHVGGMVSGWVYLKWGRGGLPVERLLARWRRRRFEVLHGGSAPSPPPPGLEAEIDRILDKISERGLDSLTPEEEKILDEASRRHDRRD